MIQISLQHTADSQCRRLEPPTCPDWAAGRSIGTTVWRRRHTRREQRVLQLCCRHSWQGGAACHRRIGGSERHGLWWCHPPGCSRLQTAEARAAKHGVSAHSYADDTQLYVHTTTDNCLAVFGRLTSWINEIAVWMASNRLTLNTGQTQFTCLSTSYQLAKVDASVFVVSGVAVDLLCSVTCLGVSIDQELRFADHIRSLACRCFFWIRQLRSVRRTLTSDTIIALVNALIISRLDYCNSVLVGAYDIHLRQLQGVLNCWWIAPAREKLAARSDAGGWLTAKSNPQNADGDDHGGARENAIGCGNVYRGNLVGFLVPGCAPMMNRDICIPVPT